MSENVQQNEERGGTPLGEPCGPAEILRQARHYMNEALGFLEKYKDWNEAGKQYAVDCAVRNCDEAWKRLNFVLTNTKERRVEPAVVCLCGSTRFRDQMAEANRSETMSGKIVLAPGVFGHSGDPLTDREKILLDALHLRKIEMADEVLVVNPEGYIGDSTRREIEYAKRTGKPVTYTEPQYERGCEGYNGDGM